MGPAAIRRPSAPDARRSPVEADAARGETVRGVAAPSASGTIDPLLRRRARDVSSPLPARLGTLHAIACLDGSEAERLLAEIALDPGQPIRLRREALLLLAGRPGEALVQACLELLGAGEQDLRLAAVQGLASSRDGSVVASLCGVLCAETSGAVARAAVRALGALGTPEAVQALLDATQAGAQPPGITRGAVLRTLAGVSNPEALPVLSAAARSPADVESHVAVLAALGRIGAPESFDLLLRALQGGGASELSCAAMQGLGLLGDPRALPALRAVERNGTTRERSYARTAIRRIETGRRE